MAKIYLSGPISGLSYEGCTSWRDYVIQKLPGSISPLRGKEFLKKEGIIEGAYEGHPFATAKGITTRDRNDVLTSDLVLVNLLGATRISIGTVMEIAWADARRIPVILVIEENNPHHHPILDTCCGFHCRTLDEAIQCAKIVLMEGE